MRTPESHSVPFRYFASLSLLLLLVVGCTSGGSDAEPEVSAALGTAEPATLEAYLKDALSDEILTEANSPVPIYRGGALTLDAMTFNSTAVAPASATTSGTNLQVAGVDEADLVKTGNGHLYIAEAQATFQGWDTRLIRINFLPTRALPTTLPGPTIGLIAVQPGTTVSLTRPILLPDPIDVPEPPDPEPARIRVLVMDEENASAEQIATIELSDLGTNIEGLYFVPGTAADAADLLVVIASGSPYGAITPDYRNPYHWENGKTSVHWIDVSDPSSPVEIDKLTFMGRLANSRRIDDQLYLVSRHRPSLPAIDPWPITQEAADENARILDSATLENLLPVGRFEGEREHMLVEPRDCTILSRDQDEGRSTALTTITQVDLRDRPKQRSACLAGTIDSLYATTESLYMTSIDGSLASKIALHKFALGAEGPQYRGTGHIAGHQWAQSDGNTFKIGEHDGVVGVITSLNSSHPDFAGTGTYEHRLTLLREADGVAPALEEISHLPNARHPAAIGKPNEFIHGVRFMGDRVYVVTFRKVDPLYILDISDPLNPNIAGQVEIPGFSDYLHPVGEDLLIGVGKDTAADVRNNWFQGIKVELFDVSDPTTLRSIDAQVVGRRGSQSAALSEHHAFTFLPGESGDVDRFTVPVSRHDTLPENGDPDSATQHYNWTSTGLHLFELVRGDSPRIDAVGAVFSNHRELGNTEWRYGQTSGDRSVIQGSAVHYVHEKEVWSAPWDDPEDTIGPQ